MNPLDVRILTALRRASVHRGIAEIAAEAGVPFESAGTRIAELRAAGFEIEDRPGFGVRLLGAPDRLIADDLVSRLGECPLIREILVFQETDSTNDIAMQRGRQGAAGGLAVFAERQKSGRGRFGRRWESASHKGLWFSLLLRPSFSFAEWPRLTTWAAVALAAAIEETVDRQAAIKWPNDVYLRGKKVAGILAETGADLAGNPFAVVGIGVNVNHATADFPAELAGKAGSLRGDSNECVDRSTFAVTLLRALDERYRSLDRDFGLLVAEAARKSTLLGHWVQVDSGGKVLEGVAQDLDREGHLLLRLPGGGVERLTGGEVTVLESRGPSFSAGLRAPSFPT